MPQYSHCRVLAGTAVLMHGVGAAGVVSCSRRTACCGARNAVCRLRMQGFRMDSWLLVVCCGHPAVFGSMRALTYDR